jgi:hypothetical protein
LGQARDETHKNRKEGGGGETEKGRSIKNQIEKGKKARKN